MPSAGKLLWIIQTLRLKEVSRRTAAQAQPHQHQLRQARTKLEKAALRRFNYNAQTELRKIKHSSSMRFSLLQSYCDWASRTPAHSMRCRAYCSHLRHWIGCVAGLGVHGLALALACEVHRD